MRAKIFALAALLFWTLQAAAQQSRKLVRDTTRISSQDTSRTGTRDTAATRRAAINTDSLEDAARARSRREKAAEDAAEPDTLKHQLRIAFDLSKPVLNAILDTRTSYEAAVDYYLRKDLYVVLEAGFGSGRFEYDDLRYTSRNAFVRAGVEKSLLVRLGPKDWDGAFAGIRYGYAPVRRSEATFTTRDTVWGGTSGTVPALNRGVSWVELTGGVRVEVVEHVQLGWTVRGKFLFSQSAFTDLRPSFIAGYGQGDKNTVFDFNVWVAYALRW